MLEPVFDPRPANTKGGLMPVITYIKPQRKIFLHIKHHPETSFAPVTRSPPFKDFVRVNEESD